MAANATEAVLNATGNKIIDILDAHDVKLYAGGVPYAGVVLSKDGRSLYLHEVKRDKGDEPPRFYDAFLARQAAINAQKEHDYDRAFTKGLLQHGRPVWAWEAHKKLQRLRTWLGKGTLKVTGEGISNAVGDAFNYTVLYAIYQEACDMLPVWGFAATVLSQDNASNFYRIAASRSPEEWVAYWVDEGLIEINETALQNLLVRYMGG